MDFVQFESLDECRQYYQKAGVDHLKERVQPLLPLCEGGFSRPNSKSDCFILLVWSIVLAQSLPFKVESMCT